MAQGTPRDVALARVEILDAIPEAVFDRITAHVAMLFAAPMASLSLLDGERLRIKSRFGHETTEIAFAETFCADTMQFDRVHVVADALADVRYARSSWVRGEPGLRFYAGAPLRAATGETIGTLCVLDVTPRVFDAASCGVLQAAADIASAALELRYEAAVARADRERHVAVLDTAPAAMFSLDEARAIATWNDGAERIFGWAASDVLGRVLDDVWPGGFGGQAARRRERARRGQRVEPFRTRAARRGGDLLELRVSIAPIRNHRDRIVGAAYVADDVTASARAEESDRRRDAIIELAASDGELPTILGRIVARLEYALPGTQSLVLRLRDGRLRCIARSERMAARYVAALDDRPVDERELVRWQRRLAGGAIAVSDIASDWPCLPLVPADLRACWSAAIVGPQGTLGILNVYTANAVAPPTDVARTIVEAARVTALVLEGDANRRALERIALFDPLTSLPNRAYLEERLRHAISSSEATNGRFAIARLDLDRFKAVNDSFGQRAGDELLREVAARLADSLRPQDTIARVGGDEFVILFLEVDGRDAVERALARIVGTLDAGFVVEGRELFVRASNGVAVYPDDGRDPMRLMRVADTALETAKRRGRPLFETPGTGAVEPASRIELEMHLARALERRELRLVYQPSIELASGNVSGAEALLRWQHPSHGAIPPDVFIRIAEETGLIFPIGAWVLAEACLVAAAWRDRGGAGNVAVNVSPRQFEDPGFVATVDRALEAAGLEAYRLTLEITEGLLVRSPEVVSATLAGLRERGVNAVIDDFGVGYSSLSYLKRFPLAALKIDRSFVAAIDGGDEGRGDEAIVRAIVGVAKALGLAVVGEGVENAMQARFLTEVGCDFAQGYLFARPKEVADLLR